MIGFNERYRRARRERHIGSFNNNKENPEQGLSGGHCLPLARRSQLPLPGAHGGGQRAAKDDVLVRRTLFDQTPKLQ